MSRMMRYADRVSTVSGPIGRELSRLSNEPLKKFQIIPNGFDRPDFEESSLNLPEKWTITYCGTVSPIQNPRSFLRAVSRAMAECPEIRDRFCIQFVGSVVGLPLHRMVQQYGLQGHVRITGYVSHRKSVRYLMQSHMLLLILNDNLSEGMVTGKLLEYLASGKPILAAVPRGEAERLVLRYARGVVVSPSDEDGLVRQILRSYALWKRGDLKVSVPRWKGLDGFDRKKQAADLAELFNNITGPSR
jgi:glycosyltransferase involved in cell wall biosynthesis